MIAARIALIRDDLARRKRRIIATYRDDPRPARLLKDLCLASDVALQRLASACALPPTAALAAVGGYGRGELYPFSDVDVLILLASEPSESEAEAIQIFVAAMWDLGLEPAHSVRTIAQCQAYAGEDVTVETALLEARYLAGNSALIEQLLAVMQSQLDVPAFFQAKRAEMRQRHAHFHDTPYALEPNCKESPGGLRDLQLLLWLSQAAGYGRSWAEIMHNGALSTSEYRSVRRAERAFRRLRIELHLLAKRREDRVLFDLQPALARIYGFRATRTRSASELLMQRYYWAARVVTQLTTILLQAIEETLFSFSGAALRLGTDFCILDSRLDLQRDDGFERNPALIFRAFLSLQQYEGLVGMTARTTRALWHARRHIDAQFRNNPVNQDLFLRILKQPRAVADTLYAMTTLNILPRYLPAFRRIVGQMQHDLFHAYTVDEHTLKVIRNLRRFAMAEYAHEYPQASHIMADFDSPWLIYIAALFHDIAKGLGGDHSELGAIEASRFCRQHSIAPKDSALVEFLVRQHLVMSLVAQKRDLSDPGVITAFASGIGSKRYLDALYLLTIADIRATNATAWNSWKAKLLDSLYQRSLMALGGAMPDTQSVLAQRKQQAASTALALGVSNHERESLWDVLDIAYFMRHEANEIAWHAEQLAGRLHQTDALVRTRVLGENEALQVMVWVPDRAHLFASICQYFEKQTLSILDARIHTTRHGWALDSFIVLANLQSPRYQDITGTVQRELALHLDSGAPLARLGRRRASGNDHGRRRARTFPIVPQVTLQPDAGNALWRLSVICVDEPGLLYKLACVFSAHHVTLKMAKIHTLGERVEDVFILAGEHLLQSRARLRFERAILAVLSGDTIPLLS